MSLGVLILRQPQAKGRLHLSLKSDSRFLVIHFAHKSVCATMWDLQDNAVFSTGRHAFIWNRHAIYGTAMQKKIIKKNKISF